MKGLNADSAAAQTGLWTFLTGRWSLVCCTPLSHKLIHEEEMIAQYNVDLVTFLLPCCFYFLVCTYSHTIYKYIRTVHIYSYKVVLCFLTTVGVNLFSPLFSYFKGSNVSPEVDHPLIKGWVFFLAEKLLWIAADFKHFDRGMLVVETVCARSPSPSSDSLCPKDLRISQSPSSAGQTDKRQTQTVVRGIADELRAHCHSQKLQWGLS